VHRVIRLWAAFVLVASVARGQPTEAPRLAFETAAGTFTIAMFPREAPRSVAHVVALVKRGFYDGQRVHRALPGFVVQFGDPRSRDLTQRSRWGRGPAAGSGEAIGVPEISPRLKHGIGAVGLSHMGEPAKADSQLYITLDRRSDLDGRYAVIGQVVDGLDVLGRLQVGDVIGRAFVIEP